MINVNPNKYGIPYQGSKYKLIPEISIYFPKADHFYDLFGGGFSVTHYMAENWNKKFKQFHYNELRPGLCELIQDAIAGKYSYKVFKPEWISREMFFEQKDINPYVKIIWSFGNNGKSYLFGKDIEKEKRSMHQAIIFDEFDSFMQDTFKLSKWPSGLSIYGKRMLLKSILRKYHKIVVFQQLERLQQLQQLQQLERLQQLQQLQQLERLERLEQLERLISFTNLDYRQVKIEKNSVIYCDIPYKNTADYESEFNHKEFFDWADQQENPVFISEYNVDDSRFQLIKSIEHRTTFSQKKENSQTIEKLYANKIAVDLIKNHKRVR